MQLEIDKNYRKKRLEIEGYYQNYLQRNQRKALRNGIINIPVVVHVVHNKAEQNISQEQIHTQIDVLNKDYRAQNEDINKVPAVFSELVSDARIEFQLASRDPDGRSSNGITRTKTDVESFIYEREEPIKSSAKGGVDPWPADNYLNVWVCKLDEILGYAAFPGTDPSKDGAVIGYSYFGTTGTATTPFNNGRTTTHEVGHWLNLLHIWGDDFGGCHGSDNIDDTPNQSGPNYGKPQFPHVSCNNGPEGDLFMNYMDYVDDDSMMMFTHAQVARMEAALYGPRSSIITSDSLFSPEEKLALLRKASTEKGERVTKMFDGCEWI